MNKAPIIVALILAVFFLATSCGSTPKREIGGHVPDFVRTAVGRAPGNAIVGIGTVRMANLHVARTISQTRAMTEISRQLQSVVKDMVTDYIAATSADPQVLLAFQEAITVTLSQNRIQGASIVYEGQDADGQYWVVTMITPRNAAAEILAAAELTAARVPGVPPTVLADGRMDTALARQSQAAIAVLGCN
ncbi:MAG: hypothetical protein FWD88_02390 [Treponema sp.]|nr:hypothetical protein [Treponema sp.]